MEIKEQSSPVLMTFMKITNLSSHVTERYMVDQLYSANNFPQAALLTCILHLIFTLLVTFLARLLLRVHTTEL